ncbi:MAG TPA: GatB/YqeY domain-containing protein [Candidatus Saccharimonadales bacterium]|nr:GatB/YqeY domain-containing protein [Candidatus Saccharimonadales bacterium]
MLKDRLQNDLKQAMMGGDKRRATLLGMLKSAILYAEVAAGSRDTGLPDEDILKVLAKEAKQRQESADIYEKAGAFDKRDAELAEKAIIEEYLPAQMSDADLAKEIDAVIQKNGPLSPQTMGKIIGQAKQHLGSKADGGRIAAYVKERLNEEVEK